MNKTIRAAAAAILIAIASCAASAQTVLYPIPEPQKEPKLVTDYPVFVNRMISEKNYEKALQYADQGLALNPKNLNLMFKRGLILERMGRLDEAREAYSKMIRLYPEIPEPYNNLAILVADSGRGDIDHAIELLQRAITANPSFSTAHENLGDLYALKALQNYRKAVPLKGGTRKQLKRVGEKITMLQIVTGNDPAPEPAAGSRPQASAQPKTSTGSRAQGAGATAAAGPASQVSGGVSASSYESRSSENSLFKPLPEIKP
ncbi:tetratricopeptide repeat protein [Mesosutterella sp. OilRF-GAM-744-9]|uniref:Tetratricopeptide repeat protein n=1 Tax=Mesosutterella porci TaxID=2915351 RepID=A0ABS9MPA9_9BURK|nr:tetratricopeptide repeat protein [Mesosutterella sp. oilRF-744-WT-GAM-9]MCG5030451.1 tetratricopeptide repeat protein [Mesosutterella sp. oilRF-744-WT-GAM-9]